MPSIRLQKERLRPLSAFVLGFGAGGLRLEPVSLLYLARPLAVSPAPCLVGSFSPRLIDRLVSLHTPLRPQTLAEIPSKPSMATLQSG